MKNKPTHFHVSESLPLLIFLAVLGFVFAVLICFFPGPNHLDHFWIIFSLFALISIASTIKILIRKPVIEIDASGIYFSRSKIKIPWNRLQSAAVHELKYDGSDDTKKFFVIKYLGEDMRTAFQIDFPWNNTLDKSDEETQEAVSYYSKMNNPYLVGF